MVHQGFAKESCMLLACLLCTFSPPFPQSSGSTHLYHVSCLLCSLAHRMLPSDALCQDLPEKKKGHFIPDAFKALPQELWFHNLIKDKATQLSLKFINTQSKNLRELLIKMQYQLILLVILPQGAACNQNKKFLICYQCVS